MFTQTSVDDDGHPVRDPASSSYLATFEPAGRFGQLVDAEARRRGSEHIRQLVVLGDGAAWIWRLADEHFPAATQIVDLYHAREHIHELATLAARLLRGHRQDWLAERLTELDAGDIPALLATGRDLKFTGSLATDRDKALAYFEDQRPPDALQAFPLSWHVRRLRRGRGRMQSRHRPAAETLRHEMDRPRCHQHRHPALPGS